MKRIGTREHAIQALGLYNRGQRTAPDWEYFDGGACREVYLHEPSNVLYKIEYNNFDGDYGNEIELRNARTLLRMADASNVLWDHLRIPSTGGFRIGEIWVIAMEFVKRGETRIDNLGPEAWDALRRLGVGDMHGGNYIVDENSFVCPIDLGSEMRMHA